MYVAIDTMDRLLMFRADGGMPPHDGHDSKEGEPGDRRQGAGVAEHGPGGVVLQN